MPAVIDEGVLSQLFALVEASERPKFQQQVFSVFLESSAENMKHLKDAVSHVDSESVKKSAHALKSSALNLGGTGFAQMCAILEDAAKKRETTSYAAQLSKIEKEHALLIHELKSRLHLSSAS